MSTASIFKLTLIRWAIGLSSIVAAVTIVLSSWIYVGWIQVFNTDKVVLALMLFLGIISILTIGLIIAGFRILRQLRDNPG